MTTKLLFVCICTIFMVLATGCVSIPFMGNATPSEPGQEPQTTIQVNVTTILPDASPKLNELGFEIVVREKFYREPNPANLEGAYFVVALDGTQYQIDVGTQAVNKEIFDGMNNGGTYRILTMDADQRHQTVWITNVLTNTKAWWKFW